MLKLLRKYQKAIFGVVAFMVIASFSFFGTYGTIRPDRVQEEDKVIGKALDGSSISSLEIARLERFLDTEFSDLMNGGSSVNLLNDGFIRKTILESGLGSLLIEDLGDKLVKFKEFKPYVHASRKIGFETVIKQFMPNYYDDLQALRSEKGGKEELVRLYLDQAAFPAEMVRQMMLYMEYQFGMQDPGLKNADLSLFYAKSLTDWFGKEFLEKVAHLVCQGSAFAKTQGYKVSFEEAKSSLLQIAMKHLKELSQNKAVTNQDLSKFYQNQIACLQMSEKDVVKIWQKVLVFRKMLDDVGNHVFVDSVMYKQFAEEASKGIKVELYRLPVYMRRGENLAQLGNYLEKTMALRDRTQLSDSFLSPEEVKGKAPELVEKKFHVRMANVKKSSLASYIGVRKTWDWQLVDAHWNILKGAFPELSQCNNRNSEGRFAYLEKLDKGIREKIDLFTRNQMVDEEFVREKLSAMEMEERTLTITAGGESEVLPGISDRKAFLNFLEMNPNKLSCYTENGEDFYHIEVLDKGARWGIVAFEDACHRGVLQKGESAFDRLNAFMKKRKNEITLGGELGNGQWALQKEELSLTRKMGNPLLGEKAFSMKEGEWSDVLKVNEELFFFKVIETFVDTSEIGKKMEEGRTLLGKEAKSQIIKELLQKTDGH